jgi:hypothetical protein
MSENMAFRPINKHGGVMNAGLTGGKCRCNCFAAAEKVRRPLPAGHLPLVTCHCSSGRGARIRTADLLRPRQVKILYLVGSLSFFFGLVPRFYSAFGRDCSPIVPPMVG